MFAILKSRFTNNEVFLWLKDLTKVRKWEAGG